MVFRNLQNARLRYDDHEFARQMFANAIQQVELGATVHEGLFEACASSLRWVNPDADMPRFMHARYRQLMHLMACNFHCYDWDSVANAVSAMDKTAALCVAREIRRQSRFLNEDDWPLMHTEHSRPP